MKKYFFFIFIFLLTGCFPLTYNSIKKISVSDSKKEVQRILGKPYSKKAYYNKDFFVYYIHEDFIDIFFTAKKFPFVGFYPILRTGNEYWIIFEDNKVASFGDAKNYSNSVPRALNNSGISLSEVSE